MEEQVEISKEDAASTYRHNMRMQKKYSPGTGTWW
jgi:hypothetical protein